MPTLIQNYNWGNALRNQNPELTRQLSNAYTDTALVVNTKSSKYFTDGVQKPHVNPPANSDFNKNFEIGDFFVRTDTDTAWIMTSRTTANAVTWKQIT
jgi:hypothetical protein